MQKGGHYVSAIFSSISNRNLRNSDDFSGYHRFSVQEKKNYYFYDGIFVDDATDFGTAGANL